MLNRPSPRVCVCVCVCVCVYVYARAHANVEISFASVDMRETLRDCFSSGQKRLALPPPAPRLKSFNK